jgi:hypothetical protein
MDTYGDIFSKIWNIISLMNCKKSKLKTQCNVIFFLAVRPPKSFDDMTMQ